MSRRGQALALSVIAASALVLPGQAVSATPAAVAPHATGDVQIVARSHGALIHSIRHANGAWDGYGTLWATDNGPYDYTGEPYSATVNGEDHVLFAASVAIHPPHLYWHHEVRHADGTWGLSVTDYDYMLHGPYPLAAVLGQLQRIGSAVHGPLQHSWQQADGTWTPWQPVPLQGTFNQYAVAGDRGDLRLVAVDADGAGLTYTVRHSDGTWSPQRQVAFATDRGKAVATKISLAEVGDDLHAVVLGDHGEVYHSILHPSGRWDLFGYVGAVAGEVGTVTTLAAAATQGTLQVAVATSTGGLYHTIRFASGTWQRYADIKHEVGDPGPVDELTLAGD